MIEEILSLFGMVSVVMGVGIFLYRSQREQQIKRALRGVPKTLVQDVVDGQVVKIVGTIEWIQPREALVSKRSCGYFSVLVTETGRSSTTVLARAEGGSEFIVRDQSGSVRVCVSDHVLAVLAGEGAYVANRDQRNSFVKENSITAFVAWNSVHVTERILTVGDRVMVAGLARWQATQEDVGSYRDSGRTLTMEGSEAVPLLLAGWADS